MPKPISVGIVGGGWRARFFADLTHALPEDVELVGVAVRRPETAAELAKAFAITAYATVEELCRQARPDLVVVAVPGAVNAEVIQAAVARGHHVLAETPPALDVEGLMNLWREVGAGGLVQIAEQYLLLPGHAARAAVIARGTIGEVTSVQVSSTHDYHAVSLLRGFLGAGLDPVGVTAVRSTAPLVDPLDRAGWTDDPEPKPAGTTIAVLDFGTGTGIYDFTDNQWHNQLRHRRIVIRGSHGEINDDSVVHLHGERTIIRSAISRRQRGYDLDLDGYDTELLAFEGEVVYRNPFFGRRLMDEEIAIATILRNTARWVRGEEPAPYPLAQACHDQLIALAIEESITSGAAVTTQDAPWRSGA